VSGLKLPAEALLGGVASDHVAAELLKVAVPDHCHTLSHDSLEFVSIPSRCFDEIAR
jgi:hypothetical protein